MARLSWLPFAFLLVLAVFTFAIQTAGGEGSLGLQGKLHIQFDKSSVIRRFVHRWSRVLEKENVVLMELMLCAQIVRTRAMFDARRQVIRAHAWSSATIAAKGVCVFLRAITAIMENVHATTISRPRKAHTNALDFADFQLKMLE
ncbi:hypothetical protein V6N13_038010 [Hibiscus sabdariffa]|uniref:Uncharacterized protein n=1 Tax=Hibiscus sabdariffa TaxID=183260 RepID=A0ABR2S486_9ROSI